MFRFAILGVTTLSFTLVSSAAAEVTKTEGKSKGQGEMFFFYKSEIIDGMLAYSVKNTPNGLKTPVRWTFDDMPLVVHTIPAQEEKWFTNSSTLVVPPVVRKTQVSYGLNGNAHTDPPVAALVQLLPQELVQLLPQECETLLPRNLAARGKLVPLKTTMVGNVEDDLGRVVKIDITVISEAIKHDSVFKLKYTVKIGDDQSLPTKLVFAPPANLDAIRWISAESRYFTAAATGRDLTYHALKAGVTVEFDASTITVSGASLTVFGNGTLIAETTAPAYCPSSTNERLRWKRT
jgi:hypothetical protein